jgi:hypothetical protein
MIEILNGPPRTVRSAYLDLLIATKCGPCSDGESWAAAMNDGTIILAVGSGIHGDTDVVVAAVREGCIVTPIPDATRALARMLPTMQADAPDMTPEMRSALRVVHRCLKASEERT